MSNLLDTTDRPDTSPSLVDSAPPKTGASDPHGFYGWRIVGFSTVAVALTAPGQTAAVSAFIDPMISGLGFSRTQLSTAYLIGTLTGAAAMPWIGRALDRYGVRRTMTTVAAAFGAVLIAMSLATNLVSVGAGFIGIRMLGQGALGLTATTATALWFTRRRGLALGLVSAVGACGISLAPLALERLIFDHGWRLMWATEGLLVWAVVLPIALVGMRDRPSDLGQRPDGQPHPTDGSQPTDQNWGLTRAQALRTRFFWVVTAAVAASGMLSTAVAFNQISLLGEHGLTPTQAAQNFLPQTIASVVATLATGAMIDRLNHRWVTTTAMASLAAGMLWALIVRPGWSALVFGLLIGAAGGSIRQVEAAAFPRFFGTAHIGSIRGLVMAISVGSTAFGPVLFALVHDATGSYNYALLGTAAVPILVAVAASFTHAPVISGAMNPATISMNLP